MDFPTIVYRCPGPHFGPNGTTYDSIGATDKEVFDALIEGGWFKSLIDAVSAYLDEGSEEFQDVTREEMLQQAQKIGLKIDKRWSDATLLQKINDFMQ